MNVFHGPAQAPQSHISDDQRCQCVVEWLKLKVNAGLSLRSDEPLTKEANIIQSSHQRSAVTRDLAMNLSTTATVLKINIMPAAI